LPIAVRQLSAVHSMSVALTVNDVNSVSNYSLLCCRNRWGVGNVRDDQGSMWWQGVWMHQSAFAMVTDPSSYGHSWVTVCGADGAVLQVQCAAWGILSALSASRQTRLVSDRPIASCQDIPVNPSKN